MGRLWFIRAAGHMQMNQLLIRAEAFPDGHGGSFCPWSFAPPASVCQLAAGRSVAGLPPPVRAALPPHGPTDA